MRVAAGLRRCAFSHECIRSKPALLENRSHIGTYGGGSDPGSLAKRAYSSNSSLSSAALAGRRETPAAEVQEATVARNGERARRCLANQVCIL